MAMGLRAGRGGAHTTFSFFRAFFGLDTERGQGGRGARPREGVIIAVFSTFFLVSLSSRSATVYMFETGRRRRARTIQSTQTSSVKTQSDPSWNTCQTLHIADQTWRLLPSPAIGLSPSLKGCSFTAGDLASWCHGQATGMLTGIGLRCICVSVEPKTLRGGAG